MITIGLKNNALFLFELMCNNNLGGFTDGIYHNKVIQLTLQQFELFKQKIKLLGYSVNNSLSNYNNTNGINYSCYLVK